MSFVCESCCEDYQHSDLVMVGQYQYCKECAPSVYACTQCGDVDHIEFAVARSVDGVESSFCQSCADDYDQSVADQLVEDNAIMRYLHRVTDQI